MELKDNDGVNENPVNCYFQNPFNGIESSKPVQSHYCNE